MSSPSSGSNSKPPTENGAPLDAKKPFDASVKADVILRSADSVHFFVLKTVLSLASPVFDHMFSSAPENAKGECLDKTRNGLPIIDLAEDSVTLYNLLLLLYPCAREPANTLGVYVKVAEAAHKYMMKDTVERLKKLVINCDEMVKEPVAAFSIAAHFRWVEVMKKAALNTLAVPLRKLLSDDGKNKHLHLISGMDYHSLLHWRSACQDAIEKYLNDTANSRTNRESWTILAASLRDQLKETGRAGGKDIIKTVPNATIRLMLNTREASPLLYGDICESMMIMMERTASNVPFKVNDIWVVQPANPTS